MPLRQLQSRRSGRILYHAVVCHGRLGVRHHVSWLWVGYLPVIACEDSVNIACVKEVAYFNRSAVHMTSKIVLNIHLSGSSQIKCYRRNQTAWLDLEWTDPEDCGGGIFGTFFWYLFGYFWRRRRIGNKQPHAALKVSNSSSTKSISTKWLLATCQWTLLGRSTTF